MELTTEELRQKINNNEKVMVDFYAPWCMPCSTMKPVYLKISEETKNSGSDIQMYIMDVEKNGELAASLGIRSIPTIKGFSGGKEVVSKTGLLSEVQIKEILNVF